MVTPTSHRTVEKKNEIRKINKARQVLLFTEWITHYRSIDVTTNTKRKNIRKSATAITGIT